MERGLLLNCRLVVRGQQLVVSSSQLSQGRTWCFEFCTLISLNVASFIEGERWHWEIKAQRTEDKEHLGNVRINLNRR